jgi:AhpD family alkylhydroperoxidase
MSTSGLLTEKEQELVAVGASVAAGCRPCTAHHVRAARAAGADKEEIRQAVNDALGVRRSASDIMARLAAKYLGDAPAEEALHVSERSLMGELVSVGAALAVNCAISLETHLSAAYEQGASVRQIQTALGIARAVKNMAAKKADEVVTKIAGESQVCGGDCSCRTDTTRSPATSAVCSCGEAERVATA